MTFYLFNYVFLFILFRLGEVPQNWVALKGAQGSRWVFNSWNGLMRDPIMGWPRRGRGEQEAGWGGVMRWGEGPLDCFNMALQSTWGTGIAELHQVSRGPPRARPTKVLHFKPFWPLWPEGCLELGSEDPGSELAVALQMWCPALLLLLLGHTPPGTGKPPKSPVPHLCLRTARFNMGLTGAQPLAAYIGISGAPAWAQPPAQATET